MSNRFCPTNNCGRIFCWTGNLAEMEWKPVYCHPHSNIVFSTFFFPLYICVTCHPHSTSVLPTYQFFHSFTSSFYGVNLACQNHIRTHDFQVYFLHICTVPILCTAHCTSKGCLRCASISWIHIGDSVSRWVSNVFEIRSTIARYCFQIASTFCQR